MYFVPVYQVIMCCYQAAETEQQPIGRDKPKKKRPRTETVAHGSPDLPQLEPPPIEVGVVPAPAVAPAHRVELAGKHSDDLCLLCMLCKCFVA